MSADVDDQFAALWRERGRAAVELAVMRARHKDADNLLLSYGRRWSYGYRGMPDDNERETAARLVHELQAAATAAKSALRIYDLADRAFREAQRAHRLP